MTVRRACLITHSHPESSAEGVRAAVAAAEAAGCELVADATEHDKHGDALAGVDRADERSGDLDLCVVLGGDGSILYALRRMAGTGVPVFGLNYGTIGFLAAAERDQIQTGLRAAFAGEFEVMSMPALVADAGRGPATAFNDIAFARRPHGRIAELSYSVGSQEIGHVRSDGLVVATPAGSTGYNLANGGPILAWGVEGYVVSFISPHTLTARALVVAPDDALVVMNAAGRDAVAVSLDGEDGGSLAAGDAVEISFRDDAGRLAQPPDANFYRRIREKFGRLAQ